MSGDTFQIFGYKCLGEGDEQTGGFFGGNVGKRVMGRVERGSFTLTLSQNRA